MTSPVKGHPAVKFQVERDVLSEAVNWTARTLPNRPPVPVLAGVLLEADTQGVLRLSSFDYEVSARVEIPAEVSDPGTILVSGRLLADISKSLPNKPVSVELKGSKVEVTCGASHFTLMTMPVEDYPALPDMPEVSGTVDADEFAAAIAQVTVAASRDETLPLLTGVRMEIEGDRITLLATDRYRLGMGTMTWRPHSSSMSTVALVRARTLSEIAKAFQGEGEITVALSTQGGAELIGFEAGGRRTTSLLIDGDYPPVKKLFPEETPIHAVVPHDVFLEAARRVALVAARNAPIRMAFSSGALTLEAGGGDDAEATEEIEAQLVGEDLSTQYNPTYLLDGLNAITSDFVRFSFTQPRKPAVITGQDSMDGEDDKSFEYLIMPIRFVG